MLRLLASLIVIDGAQRRSGMAWMQLNLGFRSGRSSSFHALFVAALSLLCLSSCGAITAARGSALPVGSIVDDSAAIRDGGGAADGAVILPTIAPGINAAMIATPPPPSFSAGAAGAAAPPQLAPVFQLSRPEMVIRPPGSEPFPAALAGSEQDVRRYIVQIAAPTTQLNAATGGGSSAPPPASPPSMASMSDAQRFLGSTLPAFDSSRLTHVFPAPPSTISSSSGLGGPSGFHGFSAFLRPSEVDALRNVSVVRSLEEDSRVKLDLRPGSMPQRASATASSSSSGNGGSIGLGVQPSNTASQGTAGRTTSVDAANLHTRSWGLDRIDQRNLPLDGLYHPSFDFTSFSTHGGAGDSGGGQDATYGAGVIIFLLDTGCKTTHREFWPSRAKVVYTLFDDGVDDANGHGTHTASTAGGVFVGAAPHARIHCLRILDAEGSGSYSDILGAMSWIRDQRSTAYAAGATLPPSIMSMSFGGSYSQALNSMTQNLVALGVHAVVAMGNNGQSACSDNSKGFSPAAAAGSSPVVAVGSSSDSDALSTFSNSGSCLTISAPGENILGAWPRDYANNTYALLSGTSMATPMVAGVMALWLGQYPQTSPTDLKRILQCSASMGDLSGVPAGTASGLLYSNLQLCSGMQLTPFVMPSTATSGAGGGTGSGSGGGSSGDGGAGSGNSGGPGFPFGPAPGGGGGGPGPAGPPGVNSGVPFGGRPPFGPPPRN